MSNSTINLFQSRFDSYYAFAKQALILSRARSLQFDIMNLQGVTGIGVEIAKICHGRGIPVVFTAHNAAFKEKEELGYSYSNDFIEQERKLLFLGDKVITVSEGTKEALLSRYDLRQDRIQTIYNGIDSEFAKKNYRTVNVREKYGIPNRRKIILNVGGTRTVKDIPFLIDSLSLLKTDNWHLALVGSEGDRHNQIMELCSARIGNKFTFAGKVSEDELLSFYHQSNLFVATSKYEGFMLAPLEAIGCGLNTLIRSTLPDGPKYFANIPELVKNNIFSTPQELASKIEHCLDEERKINGQDLEKIIKFHSWKNRANEYLQVFRQLTCRE